MTRWQTKQLRAHLQRMHERNPRTAENSDAAAAVRLLRSEEWTYSCLMPSGGGGWERVAVTVMADTPQEAFALAHAQLSALSHSAWCAYDPKLVRGRVHNP